MKWNMSEVVKRASSKYNTSYSEKPIPKRKIGTKRDTMARATCLNVLETKNSPYLLWVKKWK